MEAIDEKLMITEGAFEAQLLKKILPEKIKRNLKFISSTGFGSAISKAKSLSIRLNKNIILVLNSNTINPNETEEKKEQIEFIFRSLGKEHSVEVFLFQPNIEVIFLESNMVKDKLKAINPYFNIAPPLHLKKLDNEHVLDQLTSDEIELLRKETSLKELIELCETTFKTLIKK